MTDFVKVQPDIYDLRRYAENLGFSVNPNPITLVNTDQMVLKEIPGEYRPIIEAWLYVDATFAMAMWPTPAEIAYRNIATAISEWLQAELGWIAEETRQSWKIEP